MGFLRRVRPDPKAVSAAPPEWVGFLDGSVLQLTHPDAVRHVLHDNHANYIKGALYDDVRWILGQGLLTTEGNSWLRERKLAQPAFRPSALDAYYPVMVETTASFLREWKSRVKPGRAVEISREMSRLTLRIIAKSVFKVDFAGNEDRFLQATTELLVLIPDPMSRGRFMGRVYKYLPFWAKMRAVNARRVFEQGVSWIIENRRDPADLISYLAAGSTDAAGGSANRRIRDEVATFLLAGHETSAAGLTWTLYLLSQNPDAERRIRAEIAEILDHRPPSPADMPLLAYTAMVIQESLRLYPPIPSIARQAIQDDEIGGFKIRANTALRIKTSLIHRHPDFWPNPDRFWPERFSAEQSAARPQCTYIPFGAGPRTCIGNHFAMMEMKLALVMILQAARLRPAHGHRIDVVSNVTLRPRYGMWMIPEFSSGPD
jgi:cytochrome P450